MLQLITLLATAAYSTALVDQDYYNSWQAMQMKRGTILSRKLLDDEENSRETLSYIGQCPPHCVKCNDRDGTCFKCDQDWYFRVYPASPCYHTDSGETVCDFDTCVTCPTKFSSCTDCGDSSNPATCLDCGEGYGIDPQTAKCGQCPQDCYSCGGSANATDKDYGSPLSYCRECNTGYILSGVSLPPSGDYRYASQTCTAILAGPPGSSSSSSSLLTGGIAPFGTALSAVDSSNMECAEGLGINPKSNLCEPCPQGCSRCGGSGSIADKDYGKATSFCRSCDPGFVLSNSSSASQSCVPGAVLPPVSSKSSSAYAPAFQASIAPAEIG